jgi:Flp pilus assembly protein protease CpaA
MFLETTGESMVDRTCCKQVLVAFCVITHAVKRVAAHRISKQVLVAFCVITHAVKRVAGHRISKQVLVAFCVITHAVKRVAGHRTSKKPWEVTFVLKNITLSKDAAK